MWIGRGGPDRAPAHRYAQPQGARKGVQRGGLLHGSAGSGGRTGWGRGHRCGKRRHRHAIRWGLTRQARAPRGARDVGVCRNKAGLARGTVGGVVIGVPERPRAAVSGGRHGRPCSAEHLTIGPTSRGR